MSTLVLGSAKGIVSLPERVSDTTGGSSFVSAETAYTLGFVIGGPLLTFVSIRLGRRLLLLVSMAASVLANIAMALTSGGLPAPAGAAIIGALYGVFLGVACVTAASMAPPAWLGRALSVVVAGHATTTLLGLVLSAWMIEVMSWELALLVSAVADLLSLPLLGVLLPPAGAPRQRAGRFRAAFAPRVLAVLGIAAFLIGGQNALLAFVSPVPTGWSEWTVGLLSLLLGGVAAVMATATLAGGWAADRDARRTLLIGNGVLVLMLVVVLLSGGLPDVAMASVLVWALALYVVEPSVVHGLFTAAGPGRHVGVSLLFSAIGVGSMAGQGAIYVLTRVSWFAGQKAGSWLSNLGWREIVLVVALLIGLAAFPVIRAVSRRHDASPVSGHQPLDGPSAHSTISAG
ncbi:MFS transporter [Nonomuraea aurantiaca]|uniref:MFS transporter n=1 Tax=Nonomuraea aurantiaca TaxID=2878562 RepID=UPI001CD9B39A|nr:MFS transporter [Nonomuraea aurantiaca]MCA2228788.1 MFS transporter [Nonomuraea aurantiaca]